MSDNADERMRMAGSPRDDEEIPRAPVGMRYVGFCRACRQFVEVTHDFGCKRAGHPRSSIAVALLLPIDEPKPRMPAVNLGALFMPALWGPAHGQWFMILFYPLWLRLNNLVYGAVHGNYPGWIAALAVTMTAAFTILYATRANTYGYVRVAAEKLPRSTWRRSASGACCSSSSAWPSSCSQAGTTWRSGRGRARSHRRRVCAQGRTPSH